MNVLKVAAQSKPTAVAGAVAGLIREDGKAELQAIGAGAVNQAIKAIAISRSYLSSQQMDIVCVPAFIEVEINNNQRTALRLVIRRCDFATVQEMVAEQGTAMSTHSHGEHGERSYSEEVHDEAPMEQAPLPEPGRAS